MAVSIDKIDILMERAQVGYKEAKDVLEKFDGNVVEALIYLENEEKTTTYSSKKSSYHQSSSHHKHGHSFFEKIKGCIGKIHRTKFQILNKDRTVIDLPMTLAIILTIIGMPFSLILLAIGILTGHKISIIKPNGKNIKASEAFQFVEKQQEKFNKENDSQ